MTLNEVLKNTKLKLQNGTAEDIKAGAGSIEEVDKGFDFEVTLNDDFSTACNGDGKELISVKLQNHNCC